MARCRDASPQRWACSRAPLGKRSNGTPSAQGKTALTSPESGSFTGYWFPHMQNRDNRPHFQHRQDISRCSCEEESTHAPWKEKPSANKIMSCHFGSVSPNNKFCNADAAPTRGWVRGTIQSETNQGFDHRKQNFTACQGKKKKILIYLKAEDSTYKKIKGDKFTSGFRFIHMRSFAPPTRQPKKTPQCFQDGSFQGTKITF